MFSAGVSVLLIVLRLCCLLFCLYLLFVLYLLVVVCVLCVVQSIDLYTVKKEDLDFKSSFQLKVNRDDYCHALVAYFNVEFSKSHTKLRFSTGPRNEYTHWKQTVYYLDEPQPVTNGQIISGEITVNVGATTTHTHQHQHTTTTSHVQHITSTSLGTP